MSVSRAARWIILGAGLLLPLSACTSGPTTQTEPRGETMKLTSPAFQEGNTIPRKYTADGPDVSPALEWQDVPEGTRSLALICDDPDAPRGTWVHWVLFDLPADTTQLPEGVPAKETLESGARQGTNDFGKIGYGGPSPPAGKPHRYFFKLYALDAELGLAAGAKKQQVEKAMQGHILGQGQLMGTYGR
jgi:Raf kinase inhibitor-like YbhB/YbcL family protein